MSDARFKPLRHGTNAGYTRGCRCDDCREARREYGRAYMRRFRAGKTSPRPEETPQERRQRVYALELERIRAGRSRRVTAFLARA